MTESFGTLMNNIVEFMEHEITVDDWTFTLWQVCIFTIVAPILCFLIGELMDIGD